MLAAVRLPAVDPLRLERALGIAVFLAALATIPVTFAEAQGSDPLTTGVADWLIWATFVLEYFALLAVAQHQGRHVRQRWFELLVIIVSFPVLPGLLGMVRLGRLVRLARLLRLARFLVVVPLGLQSLRAVFGRPGLLYLSAVTALLVIAAGGLMAMVEPQTVKGGFWDGVWWAVVTVTTVGYGDISPVSVPGRLLAMALMFIGIGLVSTLAAAIAAHFVQQDSSSDLQEMQGRLERIERLLVQQGTVGRKDAD